MNGWVFLIAHALIFSIFLVVGLFALFLPQETYSKVVSRFLPVGKVFRTGVGVQRRLAGLVLALIGLYALRSDLFSVYNPTVTKHVSEAANQSVRGANLYWIPFVIGLAVVSVGFFVALNPDALVHWSQRTLFPDRQIDESTLRTWRFVFRVTGALIIFSSSGLFKLWLRS